ncbi:hypothetical protein ACN38_g6665 [Penicillium nordicum]|uniref:Uncharacterized protein n=1 Tax=Penicillium nordicum TaxID=229535 RepID=A0A0M8P6Q0_9EURO|nr:hypothetical protein ACN38_g6665 [Penicillium nordicum]
MGPNGLCGLLREPLSLIGPPSIGSIPSLVHFKPRHNGRRLSPLCTPELEQNPELPVICLFSFVSELSLFEKHRPPTSIAARKR